MILLSDLQYVLWWILLLLFLQISLFAVLRRPFPRFALPVSFSGSILLFTLFTWYLGYLHLPLSLAIIPSLLFCIYERRELSNIIRKEIPASWRYYLLFFGVFSTLLLLRVYSPDISNAEKFMDHGFLASILRDPIAPPLDPWYGGGTLDIYYYLGHWMLGSLGYVAHTPSYILFTLAIPTIAALAAVNLYAIGDILLTRFKVLPVFTIFIVNPAFVSLFISGTPMSSILWDSTRVITNTINEYPLFSFVFGDVHAHVIGIFNQAFLLLLLVIGLSSWRLLTRLEQIILGLLTALSLGTLPPVNSWDVLVYAPFIIICGFCITASCSEGSCKEKIRKLSSELKMVRRGPISPALTAFLTYCIVIPCIAMVLYAPLYLQMRTQGVDGIGIVHTPTDPVSFLLVHGWFFLILALSLFEEVRKRWWLLLILIPFWFSGYISAGIAAIFLIYTLLRRRDIPDLLAAAGLFIILICEFLYLKDNMGETYFRMNTVFKLYVSAWLLLGISSLTIAGKRCEGFLKSQKLTGKVASHVLTMALAIALLLPAGITAMNAGSYTPTLNGLEYMKIYHPEDAEAIQYLRGLGGDHILVESEGGDYNYYGRISSLTGIPAVIGWPFHEFMWRGDHPTNWYATRLTEVKMMYENPDSTVRLMKKYHADLLYIGPSEREKYKVMVSPAKNLKQVYNRSGVEILQCT